MMLILASAANTGLGDQIYIISGIAAACVVIMTFVGSVLGRVFLKPMRDDIADLKQGQFAENRAVEALAEGLAHVRGQIDVIRSVGGRR